MRSYLLAVLIITAAVLSGCTQSKQTSSVEPIYGTTNPTPEQNTKAAVTRYGSVIELLPEKEQQYRKLHADVWPEVVAAIGKANIQNYNIFIFEMGGKKYLFSYMEYTGTNPAKDFAGIGDDPTTRDKWWPITDACQKKLPNTPKGEQWKSLEMLMNIP
jgi:L-rhamnose mutarotase